MLRTRPPAGSPADTRDSGWLWNAAGGAAVWCILLPLLVLKWPRDAVWADAMLLLAALVLAPLGLWLAGNRHDAERRTAGRIVRRSCWPAAILLAAALALPAGWLAAALALPWLAFTLSLALSAGVRLWTRRGDVPESAIDIGVIYMAGGAAWAVISRAGLRPMGFEPIIVLLSAVHFHHAGFVLPLMAGLAGRSLPGVFSQAAAIGAIIGVPMLALGFAFSPSVEVLAAAILTAACTALAVLQLRIAFRARRPAVLMLLSVSALSLLSGMFLAAGYAWGQYTGAPWLDIPQMLPLHGGTNALGFGLLGVLGWILHSSRRAA